MTVESRVLRWAAATAAAPLAFGASALLLTIFTDLRDGPLWALAAVFTAVMAAPLSAWAARHPRASPPPAPDPPRAPGSPDPPDALIPVGRVPIVADCYLPRKVADSLGALALPGGPPVILTGRRPVEVEPFSPAEARDYFERKFRNSRHRLVEADLLAKDLGYLPLALAQAATFIANYDIDAAAYRIRLAEQDRAMDHVFPEEGPDGYPRPLAAAVELSIRAADEIAPVGLARPMMVLASLLDANAMPVAALTHPSVLAFLADNRTGGPAANRPSVIEARDALSCLWRNSLMSWVQGEGLSRIVRVHALDQRVVRDQAAGLAAAATRAVADALVAIWPDVERDLSFRELLRANTAALRRHGEDHLWHPRAHPVLFRVGRSLGEAGLVTAAVTHFEELAREATRLLGPDHRDTLWARSNLAYWRGKAGEILRALAETQAVVADMVRVLGLDHPETMLARSGLALWQGLSKDVPSAVATTEALLADRRRVLGAEHPATLRTRINAAHWLGKSGDASGAAAQLQELWAICRRKLGPEHPETLWVRSHLARWCWEAGDPVGAAAALDGLLDGHQHVLGPSHPNTLSVREALAIRLERTGQLARAVAEFEALLVDCNRILSPSHPLIATVEQNLRRTRDSLATARPRRWWSRRGKGTLPTAITTAPTARG